MAKREAEERVKSEAIKKAERDTIESMLAKVEYVDISCPNCNEKISLQKGISEVQCPYCDCKINVE